MQPPRFTFGGTSNPLHPSQGPPRLPGQRPARPLGVGSPSHPGGELMGPAAFHPPPPAGTAPKYYPIGPDAAVGPNPDHLPPPGVPITTLPPPTMPPARGRPPGYSPSPMGSEHDPLPLQSGSPASSLTTPHVVDGAHPSTHISHSTEQTTMQGPSDFFM